MSIQFRDLNKQYQSNKREMDDAIQRVLNHAHFISGPEVSELEAELADYVGVKHCISCANGTDALSLVLMSWGIGVGDAVFVPDFTFFASAEVIAYAGAMPIFVDVDERTFNMDPASLEEAIRLVRQAGQLKAKAIITVDLFGLPAEYLRIEALAREYGLLLLEDAAQGFGGRIGARKAGSFGDAATTSFFPAKPLGCYGDGGAIFTNDSELAERLHSLKVHGKGSNKYDNVRVGVNSRLDTLQAAILKVKFSAFVRYELEAVNAIYNYYNERLQALVQTPLIPDGYYSSFAQYSILLKDEVQRDGLMSYLNSKSIPTMVYYPKTMHEQSAFAGLGQPLVALNTSQRLCQTILSLPMHPYLVTEELDHICESIKMYFALEKSSGKLQLID